MNIRRVRVAGAFVAAAAAALALSGCGVTAASAPSSEGAIANLQVIIPNDPGGGYDVTGRAAMKVMQENGIIDGAEITNVPGAGGTVGLARANTEVGNADFLLVMGLGVVGAAYTNETEATVAEATPIARLIEEAGGIFVPANSPYQTIDDLITAWKADPATFAVGGGSSAGGPDHLLPMQLADAVGIDPTAVNFVSYAGGGELLPAVLDGQVQFAVSGYGEFLEQVESGDLRILAVTSEKPVSVVDAPTLVDSGIDLVFTNWRGILAPPGVSEEDAAKLVDAFEKMHASEGWKDVLESNGWTDAFLTGDDFATFLTEQDTRVKTVLNDLGLM